MEHNEVKDAAAGIVASGNSKIYCNTLIVNNNRTPVKQRNDKNDEKEESNKKEKQITRDICHGCKEEIIGRFVTAVGKNWHPEHWICFHCKQELHTSNSTIYYEVDGKPYCKKDYGILFCDHCASCNELIFDDPVKALGKKWHSYHFVCTHCGLRLKGISFYVQDGKPYCKNDYYTKFGTRCNRCNQPIMGRYLEALHKTWHNECFTCSDCHLPFGNKPYWIHKNELYCELHYRAKKD